LHQTDKQIKEELLILEKSKSDPACFAPIYEKYYNQVFVFVYRRVESKDLAADLTSQVFLKAMVNLRFYRFRGLPFSAWLFRVASNEVNEYYRKNKTERIISIDDARIQSLSDDIEEDLQTETEEKLLKAFEKLSDEEVQVIELRYFENRSFREVGYILKVTENNAKVKTYRLLDKLKTLIKKNF
jgi:RNA polymerase sigma-70 factor, ECF subfamily